MNSTEIAGYPKAKKEVRLPTLYYTKINSKWITDLCVRTESIRFLEEKSQVTRKKKEKDKLDFKQIKNFVLPR